MAGEEEGPDMNVMYVLDFESFCQSSDMSSQMRSLT